MKSGEGLPTTGFGTGTGTGSTFITGEGQLQQPVSNVLASTNSQKDFCAARLFMTVIRMGLCGEIA
jgi:hypothetical protein